MNKLIMLASATLLLGLLAACSGTQADYVTMVQAYQEAHNAYEIDTVMDMFAEDAVFELVGQGTLPNLDAIRAIHEYDKGIQSTLSFENCITEARTVTCEATETNNWLEAAGMGEIFYSSTSFTFTEDGKIAKISASLSPEDGQGMGAVLEQFVPWLFAERPEESSSLFTAEGVFIYSEPNGHLVVDLLEDWRATK